ncbi:MAG: hypothetical protein RMK29_11445 [Myxococcales bacterium]|nr:hypothetical protein [Myxococcales bacterium]
MRCLLWVVLAVGAGCLAERPRGPGPSPDQPLLPGAPDLSRIVPFRAVNLVAPGPLAWQEYDYRPRAQGGFREDIDATLVRLRALGVRQVLIHTLHAWSVESEPYPGTNIRATVYYRPDYRPDDPRTWGRVPRTRRGDMGLVPWYPPASWDQPQPLRNPLELAARARQVLGEMLDAVASHGLVPVLISEVHLALAEDETGYSDDFVFADPSRGFDPFYDRLKEYLVDMTRLAARHGAAMFILGSESPYVAGAGQGYFIDGSRMVDRQPLIAAKWRDIIQAVRQAARAEGRPDLVLSYAEINPFWDDRFQSAPRVPIWTRVPFWDELDAVGINYYHPGRWTDGRGRYDTAPRTADDMVAYGETYRFATGTSVVPNLADLRDFFHLERGHDLGRRPVYFAGDGCTATYLGAANPANPPFLRLGQRPDTLEQRNLYEAHFRLAERYGRGWLAGIGLWQVPPTGRWGGPWDETRVSSYAEAAAYYNFLGNETEAVVREYFARWQRAPGL